ncbi:MAG: hypothetical protein ACR2QT_11485 [Woeseiaceae bacterium]
MNWDAISALAEVIGVIAVIASLIYVGFQIKQNTEIARANIVHETSATALRIHELIAQDASLADIYRRGTSGTSLKEPDLGRFIALVHMYLTWLEDVDSQYGAGLYFDEDDDEDLVDYMARDFGSLFSTPAVCEWWHTRGKLAYRPSFVQKVDKHVSLHG